jgi:pilus assembly protein CpaC
MKKYIIFGLAFLIICHWQILSAQETIQVIIGQQRNVTVPRGAQINIGDPSIATARALNQRKIIITGRSKGATSLTIISSDGKIKEKIIEVLQRDPKAVIKEIKAAFGEIEGVKFEVVGSMLLAKGSVYTLNDMDKFSKILSTYPEIIDLTEDLTEKRMISVDINIIEVSKTSVTDYNNTDFPNATISVTNQPQKGVRFPEDPLWTWGTQVDRLLDRVSYWVTTGRAKIVANPTIAVTDGNEASFMSGGEIPFEYHTRDGLAIEWKEYGIIINIKPVILGNGNILLDLEAEISSLDRTYQTSSGISAITSRKANSVSVVKPGETIALAGIYQTLKTKSYKRVPILGYILPFLFSSVNNNEETKEIIVLVTPNAPANILKKDYPMIQKMK